jgi:hypothetical protein
MLKDRRAWWQVDGTGIQPLPGFAFRYWGVAPGWYEDAPLALAGSTCLVIQQSFGFSH